MSLFDELVIDTEKEGKRLNQHLPEFKAYLEYVYYFLKQRRVAKPLVVEIGILDGAQKKFYEKILNANYIGIDIDPKAPARRKDD